MRRTDVRINGRFLISASSDPGGLSALCARRCPDVVRDDSEFPCIDDCLSLFPEPGKGKGFGVRTEIDLAAGAHVGWVEGLVTLIHPGRIGESFSYQLSENPNVYFDSGEMGSLVTFINEDLSTPNCVAARVVHHNQMRIRVSTCRPVPAGSALSLSYRLIPAERLRLESSKHHWGRAVTPAGQLSTGLRHCANRRYHVSDAPKTSMLCVECSAHFSRAVSFCSDSCFSSHVADHASDDPEDVLMCTPVRANNVKPVVTRLMTPRSSSRS
jgi:hypothetical protein